MEPFLGNGPEIPPRTARKYREILRAKPGAGLVVVLTGYASACWLHFVAAHAFRCPGLRDRCLHCHDHHPRKWFGYLPCYEFHSGKLGVVEFSPTMADSLVTQLDHHQQKVYGALVEVQRLGSKTRSPIRVTLLKPAKPLPFSLPEPEDLTSWLEATYRYSPFLQEDNCDDPK